MKTKVKKWGINGEGIAFHKGKPVFIENAIPNEIIEFDIKRKYNHTNGLGYFI